MRGRSAASGWPTPFVCQVVLIEGLDAACVSKTHKLTRGMALGPSNDVVLQRLRRGTTAALCALVRSRECLTLTTRNREETVRLAAKLVRAVGTEALLFHCHSESDSQPPSRQAVPVPEDSESDVIDLTASGSG